MQSERSLVENFNEINKNTTIRHGSSANIFMNITSFKNIGVTSVIVKKIVIHQKHKNCGLGIENKMDKRRCGVRYKKKGMCQQNLRGHLRAIPPIRNSMI